MMCMGMTAHAASKKWTKACKVYSSFLAKNVSSFEPRIGDLFTINKENYKKSSSFKIVDMDKDGVPELLTWHKIAYRQDDVYIYTYKNGKMVRVKDSKGKSSVLAFHCNAAGWYSVYVCTKGHLHTDWHGGWIGEHNTAYVIRNGRLKVYLDSNIENIVGKATYKVNGKKVSQKKFNSMIKGCKCKNSGYFQKNTKSNRKKYVK